MQCAGAQAPGHPPGPRADRYSYEQFDYSRQSHDATLEARANQFHRQLSERAPHRAARQCGTCVPGAETPGTNKGEIWHLRSVTEQFECSSGGDWMPPYLRLTHMHLQSGFDNRRSSMSLRCKIWTEIGSSPIHCPFELFYAPFWLQQARYRPGWPPAPMATPLLHRSPARSGCPCLQVLVGRWHSRILQGCEPPVRGQGV